MWHGIAPVLFILLATWRAAIAGSHPHTHVRMSLNLTARPDRRPRALRVGVTYTDSATCHVSGENGITVW